MVAFIILICGTLNLQPVNCKPVREEMPSMELCLKRVESSPATFAYCDNSPWELEWPK